MTIKVRHHYVWRNYLRPWSDDDYIWCARENKIFRSNLMNIGQIKYFYKLKDLSSEEVTFLNRFIEHASPSHLQVINKRLLESFAMVFKLKNTFEATGAKNKKTSELIEKAICNFGEDLHGGIEAGSIKYLNSLLAGDTSFYEIDEGRMNFLHYLCIQYMRTNKIREGVVKLVGTSADGVGFENTWGILSHVFSNNMAWHLHAKGESLKLLLLKNNTPTEFLAGDQPVVNTHASGMEGADIHEHLEFYYPISPAMAILITEENIEKSNAVKIRHLSCAEVKNYNQQIIEQSHSQIYASSEKILQKYIN